MVRATNVSIGHTERGADTDIGTDDEDAVWEFLHGACFSFALALHARFGWQLALVFEKGGEPIPFHAIAIRPDGKYFDAAGEVTESDLCRRYGARRIDVKPAEPKTICHWGGDDEFDEAMELLKKLPYFTDEKPIA